MSRQMAFVLTNNQQTAQQSAVRALSGDARRNFQARFKVWISRGMSVRAAAVLALNGVDTIKQVSDLGRDHFKGQENCGGKTLAELGTLAGWPAEQGTPVDAIAAALQLAIADPEEAREAATDAVIALRRSGFVIAAKRQSELASRQQ